MGVKVRVATTTDAFLRFMRRESIRELDEAGQKAKAYARSICPVKSGYARNSIYYVVIDETGKVVGGDEKDGNGVAIPRRGYRGTGEIRLLLGANAPYFIYIELGARGRPGQHVIQRAGEMLGSLMQSGLGSIKVG